MPKHSPKATTRTACDGFIVVAVLWILAGLSALVSAYATYVIQTAAGMSVHDDQLRARALVMAAIELMAYRHVSANPQVRETRGQFNFRLQGANATVGFRSEAARVDLNAAPKEVISGLFKALGAPADAAETYAERVIGWRTPVTPDRNGESPFDRKLGYAPRGGKFPHVHELVLVPGIPASLVERSLPFVTVYSGRSQIAVFDADPEVLASMPGISRQQINAIQAHRGATSDVKKRLLTELGSAQQFATVEGSKAIRTQVDVVLDRGYRSRSEVVILMTEDGDEPYSILSWHDGYEDAFR